jgi:hypothetical protein
MSSTNQQHFTSDDLDMLRRVLDNADLHDRPSEIPHPVRSAASRFLITRFQQGNTSEIELRFELFHHLYQDTSERARAGEHAEFQVWENEGGAVVSEAHPNHQPSLRLVAGQTSTVRRIMLGFPAFTLSHDFSGADDDIPRVVLMAA